MSYGRPQTLANRFLPALAILLALSVSGATCSENAGRVFNGGGDTGDGGDGGDGGVTPPRADAPAIAQSDGALVLDGPPLYVASGPSDGLEKVDVLSPIAIWFSESLNPNSVTTSSLQVRRIGATGGVLASIDFYVGNRCVIIEPTSALEVNSQYQIIANDDIHDLDGERLVLNDDGVLATFSTAFVTSGRNPKVTASFPPAGSIHVPNDHDALIVFSKPVSYTTAIPAIHIEQINNSGVVLGNGAFDTPSSSLHGSRVFLYTRTEDSDALDIAARMQIKVDAGVNDTEFEVSEMSKDYQSIWNTLPFGRPLAITTTPTPAANEVELNLTNLGAYPVNVEVNGNLILESDVLHVQLSETTSVNSAVSVGLSGQSASVTSANVAGTAHTFLMSVLLDPLVPLVSKLADGPVSIGAFVERGSRRSTVLVTEEHKQDTVPPSLQRFGPPFAFSAGTFVTDLPEFRPYGQANEPIAITASRLINGVDYSEFEAADPSDQDWFLGPIVDGISPNGRFSLVAKKFDLILTDTAGNSMAESVQGRVLFRSFLGPFDAGDSMTLEAVDARTLAAIPGCTFELEAENGTDFRDAVTSFVGEETFDGLAGRSYNVTISAPGYHTATFYGLDRSVSSLPLRAMSGFNQSVSPAVTLESASSGEVRLASSVLLDDELRLEPDGMVDVTVPFDFGFTGSPVQADRPGWFAAFFRLSSSDPFLQFALDPRVIVDPISSSTITLPPELSMVPIATASRDQYLADWAAASGDPDIQTSAVTRLPGLGGLATIGIGEDLAGGPGVVGSTITVLHALTSAAADAAGVDESSLEVDLLTRGFYTGDGHATMRLSNASASGSNTVTWVSALPTVKTSDLDPQAIAGEQLKFLNSLDNDGAAGYYLVTLDDGFSQWDLWVPASLRSIGHPVFPTLDNSPLDDNLDAVWTMFVEGFHMPAGFDETGFFFSELRRDFDALTRSALKTVTL